MCFKVMLFDLDETLYPHTSGIWQAIGLRMDRYIIDQLNIRPAEVTDLRNNLFHQYGTTLRGLREVYGINESEFLTYVHDIPIDLYLQKDEALIDTLSLFTQRKVIFTNADTNHAKRVLNQLGINHFFSQVIDIQAIHPYCKPMTEAFRTAINLAAIADPSECIMIDDSERNLFTAHELGFYTIHVGTTERQNYVDAAVATVYELPDVIPA
jgi:putative hydrolase of the HAD superfamily